MARTKSHIWATFASTEFIIKYESTKKGNIAVRIYFDKLRKSGIQMTLDKNEAVVLSKNILKLAKVSTAVLRQIKST